MAMTVSRLGAVNQDATATDAAQRALFLQVFIGEILASFEQNSIMLGKHLVRTIPYGKSASFPCTGKTTAGYHTPGAQVVGKKISHNEKVVPIDGLLLTDVFLANIDEAMNHFDVRGIYSNAMGEALAVAYDKNVIQEGILGARASALITGNPNGANLSTDDFKSATLATRAAAYAKACFDAAVVFDTNNVPDNDRYLVVKPTDYYALVQNKDAINKDWGGSGAYSDGTVFKIAGVTILKSNNVPSTDLSAADYHGANFALTKGLFFTPSAIGTVKLMDLAMESEYLIDYQGTLMVAKYAMGHGWLRPECLIEVKTAT